jgi:hypothetical protein
MRKKFVLNAFFLLFAFGVLLISILKSASIKYSFSGNNPTTKDENVMKREAKLEGMVIDYYLPYAGSVLPDSPLWVLKVARDRLWLAITPGLAKKSELNLLFADKRLQAARILFEEGKNDLAYSTLAKSCKYLEISSDLEQQARDGGENTLDLAETIVNASLKHRHIIREISLLVSDDVRPKITLLEDKLIVIYQQKANYLLSKGRYVPINPFDGNL